jgi:hypothetical protein
MPDHAIVFQHQSAAPTHVVSRFKGFNDLFEKTYQGRLRHRSSNQPLANDVGP